MDKFARRSTFVAVAAVILLVVGALTLCCTPAALAADKGMAAWFAPLMPRPHKYWHPPLVHFPIVFTLLEFVVLVAFLKFGNEWLDTAARWCLWFAGLGSIPVVLAGVHDSGVDLGGKSGPFIDGIQDRIANLFNPSDPLSVHVLWIAIFLGVLVVRLLWRARWLQLNDRKRTIAFLASSAVTCVVVLVAAQAGGVLSHP